MKTNLFEFKIIASFLTDWNSSRAKRHRRKTFKAISTNEDRAHAAAIEFIDLNHGGCINIHSVEIVKPFFETAIDASHTEKMSRYILNEKATFVNYKTIKSLNWSPSSSEMREIARIMRANKMLFTDSELNEIHKLAKS